MQALRRLAYAPATRRFILLVTQGLRLRVLGRRHVPRKGPLVIVCGHFGLSDLSMVQVAVRRPFGIMLDEELMALPTARVVMGRRGVYPMKHVPVGFSEHNVRQVESAAEAVRAGGAVALFPQGFTDEVGGGAARIAAGGGAPVVPVMMYVVRAPRAWPRALLLVRRPLPPPEPDARARRRLRDRLRRQMCVMGSLWTGRDARAILNVVLDDPRLWRRPLRVPRLVARVRRLPDERKRVLARRARTVLAGCRRLRCSIGDLRAPPGVRDVAGWLLLAGPAAAGCLLCGPLLLALRVYARRVAAPDHRRLVRIGLALQLWLPYAIALAIVGAVRYGPWGLLLPPAASLGMVAFGLAKPLHRRVGALPRVLRHGPRLRRVLARFAEDAP